jgi:hypothetical protein
MTDRTEPDHTPTVAEEMVRELGIAPALTSTHESTKELVESIRSQTDDAAARAKATLAHEREEAHEQSMRPANWATGGGPSTKSS